LPLQFFRRKKKFMGLSVEDKIKRYTSFWNGYPVERPMVGFSLGGWFSFMSYSAIQKYRGAERLTPDMLSPERHFDDYDRIVAPFEEIEDDVIHSVAPIPAFPWLEAMLGIPAQVGNESIWVKEGGFDYRDTGKLNLSKDNPWRKRYLEFVSALQDRYGDRYPVGQPILRGTSDMVAALRGTQQMIFDLYDHPQEFQRLARACTDFFICLVKDQLAITKPFQGGYVVEQFTLWAPDGIVRMQEDASALFSPDLYVKYLQEEDWRIASAFPYDVIHLHSSSLHLLDRFVDVEPQKCIEINKDQGGWGVDRMLPLFKMVQSRGKKLIVRGKLDLADLELLCKELSPRGLFLQIVIDNPEEAKQFRDFFRPWG
jgi:5-methyltetrahydrofolate--homocysteine methyltransferase